MNRNARNILLNISLVAASLLCALATSEMLARLFLDLPPGYAVYSRERAVAHASIQRLVPDSRLLHRMPPDSPGHDARGFRNPDALASADVVAIGDSQTWGINVRAGDTWPAILEGIDHVRVYSMALGGWGPVQYEELARDALVLKPKAILVGMYLGNDVFDACNHVYGTDAYRAYRRSQADYASVLSELHARLNAANDQARVEQAHRQLAEMGKIPKLWQALARRSLIGQTLMTRGLLPMVPSVDDLYRMADETWAQEHSEVASVYKAADYSTVLTFGYRGVAVDLTNACIRDGVMITKGVVGSLQALGARSDTRVAILFIPTKERVYAEADQALQKSMNGTFADLVKNEQRITHDLLDHCRALGMVCLDAVVWMVEAVQKGVVLYRADSDGHPIAEGYRRIALAGHEALKRMRVLSR